LAGLLQLTMVSLKKGPQGRSIEKVASTSEGTALDISTAGMSDDEKLRLVDSLQKAGFQGLGFGKTLITQTWANVGLGTTLARVKTDTVVADGKTVGELITHITV
jgi:hypothetical protein